MNRPKIAHLLPALLLALVASPVAALDDEPGFVDGARFIEIAGDEAISVEVRLGRTLLNLACSFDEELCEAIGGLEAIHAVILDMSEVSRSRMNDLRDAATDLERRLIRSGWERMVMIREEDSTARVLILATETTVQGLVFIGVEEEELVFTNIAGEIDLEKLGELVEGLDVPGLEDIDVDEIERKRKKNGRKND